MPQRTGLYQHSRLLHLPEELRQLRPRIPPQWWRHTLCWYGRKKTTTFFFQHKAKEVHMIMFCVAFPSADIDECKGAEKVCEGHGCINLLGSYRCECEPGYIFNSISRVCEGKQFRPPRLCCQDVVTAASHCHPFWLCALDINECRHYPGRLCAHKCENTLGSYKCSCTTGFKIAGDGRNCDGKINIY